MKAARNFNEGKDNDTSQAIVDGFEEQEYQYDEEIDDEQTNDEDMEQKYDDDDIPKQSQNKNKTVPQKRLINKWTNVEIKKSKIVYNDTDSDDEYHIIN